METKIISAVEVIDERQAMALVVADIESGKDYAELIDYSLDAIQGVNMYIRWLAS